jgi:succinate-semialdehyde dehydrogenase/glutarate-semialdehyde dehydrogenase
METDMTEARTITYPPIGLLINGEWIYDRPIHSQVENPSTEAILGTVPRANAADLTAALQAAARGFEVWRKTTPTTRAALLRRAAALVRERVEEIAPIFVAESGRTLAEVRAEIERSATFLDWDSEELKRNYGRMIPSDGQAICCTRADRPRRGLHPMERADERPLAQDQRSAGDGLFHHPETRF